MYLFGRDVDRSPILFRTGTVSCDCVWGSAKGMFPVTTAFIRLAQGVVGTI